MAPRQASMDGGTMSTGRPVVAPEQQELTSGGEGQGRFQHGHKGGDIQVPARPQRRGHSGLRRPRRRVPGIVCSRRDHRKCRARQPPGEAAPFFPPGRRGLPHVGHHSCEMASQEIFLLVGSDLSLKPYFILFFLILKRGAWVSQAVECPTLNFCSGPDLGVGPSSPVSGSVSAGGLLEIPPSLLLSPSPAGVRAARSLSEKK